MRQGSALSNLEKSALPRWRACSSVSQQQRPTPNLFYHHQRLVTSVSEGISAVFHQYHHLQRSIRSSQVTRNTKSPPPALLWQPVQTFPWCLARQPPRYSVVTRRIRSSGCMCLPPCRLTKKSRISGVKRSAYVYQQNCTTVWGMAPGFHSL